MNGLSCIYKYMLIGVLDSGAGGINVLNECRRIMPAHDYLYYADDFHAPYGNKPPELVIRHTVDAADYMVGRGISCLVVACNTATSAAADVLRGRYSISVVGTEPALMPAAREFSSILLLCTAVTAQLKKLEQLRQRIEATITTLPMPELASEIESSLPRLSSVYPYLYERLSPLYGKYPAVVLGCTHYCFVKDMIGTILNAKPFCGSLGVANMTARLVGYGDSQKIGSVELILSSGRADRAEIYRGLIK